MKFWIKLIFVSEQIGNPENQLRDQRIWSENEDCKAWITECKFQVSFTNMPIYFLKTVSVKFNQLIKNSSLSVCQSVCNAFSPSGLLHLKALRAILDWSFQSFFIKIRFVWSGQKQRLLTALCFENLFSGTFSEKSGRN